MLCGCQSDECNTMESVEGVCQVRNGSFPQGQEYRCCPRSPHILCLEVGHDLIRIGVAESLLTCSITGPMTFEQDKSWLRIGVAIRTGIDINLHRVALSKSARQGLPNWLLRMIIRTWLLTYIIDRTLSAQLGKPATMRGEHSFQLYSDLISRGEGKTIDDAWVSSLSVRPPHPLAKEPAEMVGMDSSPWSGT